MRIMIFDDEPEQCAILAGLLKECIAGSPEVVCVHNVQDALSSMEQKPFDIIFQDIELGEPFNGIKIAQLKQKDFPGVRLVYITAHIKYAEEIFSTSPDALLLKPFTRESVQRVLDILREKQAKTDRISLTVGKCSVETIDLGDIAFIETISRRLTFFDGGSRAVHEYYDVKISDIVHKLPGYFVQCHKSFCVNLRYVRSLARYQFTLEGGTGIPVSKTRYNDTHAAYLRFLEEQL